MLILSRSDVKAAVTMTEAIGAAASALAAYTAGDAEVPLRIHIAAAGGAALYMPGLIRSSGALGAKIVSVFGGNPARGVPTITAAMILQDAATGQPLALMEAGYLTALRTGAAAGVATRYLARRDRLTVAIYGAGVQARTQYEAVAAVRDVREVLVYDPVPAAATALAAELSSAGVAAEVLTDPDGGPRRADLIIAATTSTVPVFDGRLTRPGTHVNAIGSYTPAMQELDPALLQRADLVVCDAREATLKESGDLVIPVQAGLFGSERVDAEVGDLVLGRAAGRTDADQITVYKGVGLAALDLATAQLVYSRAQALGLGQTVDILK